jgi:hypothetical protein
MRYLRLRVLHTRANVLSAHSSITASHMKPPNLGPVGHFEGHLILTSPKSPVLQLQTQSNATRPQL